MPNDAQRYELTASLSTNATSVAVLDELTQALTAEVVKIISGSPTVTAYFLAPDYESFEIRLGLRFEGLPSGNIEGVASSIVEEAITRVSGPAPQRPAAVREESTLVSA